MRSCDHNVTISKEQLGVYTHQPKLLSVGTFVLYVTNAYTNRQVFITFNVTTSKKQLGVCTMYSLNSRSAIAFVCRDLCAESLNH